MDTDQMSAWLSFVSCVLEVSSFLVRRKPNPSRVIRRKSKDTAGKDLGRYSPSLLGSFLPRLHYLEHLLFRNPLHLRQRHTELRRRLFPLIFNRTR